MKAFQIFIALLFISGCVYSPGQGCRSGDLDKLTEVYAKSDSLECGQVIMHKTENTANFYRCLDDALSACSPARGLVIEQGMERKFVTYYAIEGCKAKMTYGGCGIRDMECSNIVRHEDVHSNERDDHCTS